MSRTTTTTKGGMRALQLTQKNELSITTVPRPSPSAGQMLIKIHASPIQPSDIVNYHGGFSTTTFPRIPGRDFSGVIDSVGEGVSTDLVGKAVFGTSGDSYAFTEDGFQAEYAIVSAGSVAPKPEALTHTQAATLGVPLSTAALIVKAASIQKDDRVLVLGANGAVGSAVCTLLDQKVIKGVRGSGGDVDTAADPLLKAAGKVDVVIDTVGMTSLTESAVDILGTGGRLVFIAASKTDPVPKLTIKMLDFYREERRLIGVNSILKSAEFMAGLLGAVEESKLVQYAQQQTNWTTISLEDAVQAYNDKTKGKKFVIEL